MSNTAPASHPNARTTACRAPQRGAALIVSLVMMLALTVLGISGMNMSTLELAMANNAQAQQQAFQRAENGINLAISDSANPSGMPPITEDLDSDGTPEIESETDFISTTLVPDGSGWSTDMAAYHFDTVSTGTGPRNAVAIHNQSFYVIGPSSN